MTYPRLPLARTAPLTRIAVAAPAEDPVYAAYRERSEAFYALVSDLKQLRDPAFRDAVRPKLAAAYPAHEAAYAALRARPQAVPEGMGLVMYAPGVGDDAFLLAVGDADARARVAARIASADPQQQLFGRASEAFAALFVATDEAAQIAAVAKLRAAFDAAPEATRHTGDSLVVTMQINGVGLLLNPDEAVKDSMRDLIVAYGSPEMAKQITDRRKAKEAGDGAVGKPIVLAGLTPDGKPFSTAQWKGKVVLVDFWATWCGPCVAELPRIRGVYDKYHADGLEILGVSSDENVTALTNYVAQKNLPWPNLFDPDAKDGEFHALARKYNINAIPVMYLIDRNGVLRSVEARGQFETLVPALLKEPAAAGQ